MKALLTNSKWRWFISFVLVAVVTLATCFLSEVFGRQKSRRPAEPLAPAVNRTPAYVPGNFTFSTPFNTGSIRPNLGVFFQGGGEPEIKVDVFGNIYLTAIQGVPGGTDLFKSTDHGTTFTYLGQPDGAQNHCAGTVPQCLALGGGDDQIDVSPGGYLYVSSLWLGNITMSVSYDGGTGGIEPGQKWEVNPASANLVSDDRQWVAAYGPQTVYMSFATTALTRPPGSVGLFMTKSTDGGKTFPTLVEITAATPLDQVNVEGNLVVDPYNGNLYTAYITNANHNIIKFARSSDGGTSWTITDAYVGAVGTTNRGVFPIVAVDRGGNVHLVFTNSTEAGHANCHVYLTSTADQGASWLPAVQVDNGAATATAALPWVVAGSDGHVNITWLGSPAATPDVPSNWHVFFAQTANAMSASPIFAQNQAETATMHDHSVCFAGGGCASAGTPNGEPGNRDMLEYYTMALDPDGNANITYPDSVNGCPTAGCRTNAWFVKQTGGASAYVPPAAPAAASFSANLGVGAPGAEPSIWVDSYNCIYVTAPGQPFVWKSVNNGLSFLSPTEPVADEPTLTGGDEDIITLRLASGARPDEVYFADLGLSTVHIRKSTNGGATWAKPGTGGSGGDTAVSSDRQWLAVDRGVPTASDFVVYEWDHELASEIMRMSSMVNDTAWQTSPGQGALSDPELATTVPNTNPGPVFVDKSNDPVFKHRVYGLFNASVPTTNAANPPFGKLLNIWDAVGLPPASAGAPPTFAPSPLCPECGNHPVFKGVYDSPAGPVPPAPPLAAKTFGGNNANIFPAGDIDSAGNIYVAWSMNNARTNEFSIWFAASHDHGQTFYGPFPVSSGPMTADETAVLPWVAAGDNGRVDIVWYGTTAVGDPNTVTGNPPWKLFFAQTLNGNSREPVFTVTQPNPANVIHNGQISTGGLIGSSDRSLLDFFEVAIGPDGLANIIFADNAGQPTRAEYTRQTGGPLALTSPTTPTCLAAPSILPISAVSIKTHGGNATYPVDLPLTGSPGIECRAGSPNQGDHTVVISFANTVTVGAASVASSDGLATADPPIVSNQIVTVNLHNVTDMQTIIINLTNVSDGTNTGNTSVPMAVLFGDINANRNVTGSDVNLCKAQVGSDLSSSNFRNDVNVTGFVSGADVNLVKAKVGGTLGP